MNRDDQDAALAHQQELEQREREEQQMLGSAEYREWIITTLQRGNDSGHDEVRGQRIEVSEGR